MKELVKNISKLEWFLILSLSLVMIVITGLPYLYAYLNSPPGFIYNGLHAQTPETPVYYDWIRQTKEGNLLIKDYFTSEPQRLGMFNIFWLGIGGLAKILNFSPALIFHFTRLFLIPILLLVIYLWLILFFSEVKKRKLGFMLLVFGSGIGAYFAGPLSQIIPNYQNSDFWPIDLWVTEAFVFTTIYQSPHFIMSWILLLLILLLMFLAFEWKKVSYAIISGILGLIYFNFHPYYVLTIFGTLIFYLTTIFLKERKVEIKKIILFLIFVLIASISIFYHFWLIKNEPIIYHRATQNVTLLIYFIPLFLGYGFFWPLAILGIYKIFKDKNYSNKFIFLISWLITTLILLFFPTPFQSRYTEGLQIPLAIFSVVGLYFFYNFLKIKFNSKFSKLIIENKILWLVLLVLLFCSSTLFNWTRDLVYFQKKNIPIFYLNKKAIEGFLWLADLPKNQVILASPFLSFFIPSYSGQKIYLAHQIETLNFDQKKILVLWFFSSNGGDQQKNKFLKENKINYLFFSSEEKKLGEFNPVEKNYLKLVYQNEELEIYEIID